MSQDRTLIIKLRALAYVASITRFNLFILVAGIVLLFVGQGQDLLVQITLGEKTHWIASLSLLAGATIWAFSIWYWARVLLNVRFPDPPIDYPAMYFWRVHLPRLLGLLAFAGLIWNLYRAVGWQWEVGTSIGLALFYYLAVLFRRDFAQWLTRTLRPEAPESHWAWAESVVGITEPQLRDWRDVLHSHWVKALLALGLVLFLWGMIAPLSMGLIFNTPLLLMLWGATFLPWGSALTYFGNRSGMPLYTLLIVLAVIFSQFNDNHQIRPLTESKTPPADRPTIDKALDRWIAENCQGKACPPFIVVATAGGGIRASYWTGAVLGELHDGIPQFSERLFAISGVSGGSVGAAVYRAALQAGVSRGEVKEQVLDVLGQDFLTPVSVGLLYPDFLQRFMPVAIFDDRAAIFERGLETGFTEVIGQDTLSHSFAALTTGSERPWPALFLNSTWSENGRRIVAAGLDLSHTNALYSDLLDRLGYDIRLSTAAHNSARFPLVSPPGSWTMKIDDPKQREALGEVKMLQRLQDGGLFENYGAATALEILQAARHAFKRHPDKPHFDPLVILISSDPGLPDDLAIPDLRKPINFGYEALSTLRTYAATRVGRGAVAAARLRGWIRGSERESRYAHFRMCGDDEQADPPLGWALSPVARAEIRSYLPSSEPDQDDACRGDNWSRLKAMEAQIGAEPTPPKSERTLSNEQGAADTGMSGIEDRRNAGHTAATARHR
jgi:hypothetical protein